MNNDNIVLISNNVKGIQNKEQRIKMFEYHKSYAMPTSLIFLQDTDSTILFIYLFIYLFINLLGCSSMYN